MHVYAIEERLPLYNRHIRRQHFPVKSMVLSLIFIVAETLFDSLLKNRS